MGGVALSRKDRGIFTVLSRAFKPLWLAILRVEVKPSIGVTHVSSPIIWKFRKGGFKFKMSLGDSETLSKESKT